MGEKREMGEGSEEVSHAQSPDTYLRAAWRADPIRLPAPPLPLSSTSSLVSPFISLCLAISLSFPLYIHSFDHGGCFSPFVNFLVFEVQVLSAALFFFTYSPSSINFYCPWNITLRSLYLGTQLLTGKCFCIIPHTQNVGSSNNRQMMSTDARVGTKSQLWCKYNHISIYVDL